MASQVPRDPTITPEMRRFLDDLARQQADLARQQAFISTIIGSDGGITTDGRIWVRGSGSPTDSEPIAASNGGQILISSGAGAQASLALVGYGTVAGVRCAASEGTPAAPTATASGTTIAFLGGHGHDGAIFTAAAKAAVLLKANEAFTPTAQGTRASIECTQVGTTTRTEVCQIDKPTTATQTALLLWDVDNATLERVTVGAADSGGAGFKVLRIPN